MVASSFLRSSALLGCLTLHALCAGACSKEQSPAAPPPPSAAEQAKAKQEAERAQRIAQAKAKREAEAKAAKEAEAKKKAAVEALLVAPDKAPKRLKIKKACAKLAKTYDAFMHRLYTGKVIEQWDDGAKKMQLTMTKKNCMQHNVKVALCQIHALEKATDELKKEVPAFFRGCIDKYGDKKN